MCIRDSLSHGSLVNTSDIIYTPCEYNLNQETGRVDYDQMEEVALREKPKDVYKRQPSILPCDKRTDRYVCNRYVPSASLPYRHCAEKV